MKVSILKMNSAQRLLLTMCKGYGDDEVEVDDEDKLSSFFDEVLSGDLDAIPDEEDEVEEADMETADPETSEAEGGTNDDEVKPVVAPVVKDTPEVTAAAPVVEQQTDPVVTPTPVEAPVKTDAERQKEYDDTIRELEKVYAISDEDADAILTDPKTVLPQMQARAHVLMVQTMHNMITALVPQLIQQVGNEQTTKKTLMDQFAAAWPDLVSKDVEPTVIQAVVSVRKQYPNASQEELIKKVGPVAYALLGKEAPVKQITPVPAAAPKAKARPFTPAKQQAAPPKTLPSDPMGAFFADIFEGKI